MEDGVGRRTKMERMYIYICIYIHTYTHTHTPMLIHFVIQQKLTQHCKEIIRKILSTLKVI